jgi:energy-converting hydrogenase Eha subunit C
MCLSESVSWTTLIIGTIVNILCINYLIRLKNKNTTMPILFIIAWQYALLMQIPDALEWRNPNKSGYPGKLAYFLNTTQPLVVVICVAIAFQKLDISLGRLIPAIISLVVYMAFVIKDSSKRTNFNIEPDKNCRNLNYQWWNNLPVLLYFTTILLVFASIPNTGYIVINSVIFIGSIIATKLIVGNHCNPGSLWCWSVASAGPIIFLYYILQKYFL